MKERFERNVLVDGVGVEGQRKLHEARVLVVGAGGLGSPLLYYLAAAGVGTLGIIDSDVVDLSNLQRQILHRTKDVDIPKVASAKEKLQALYPQIHIEAYYERFTASNGVNFVKQYDIVVDCCDNFETKYLINDLCVAYHKPYCHGAVLAMRGEVMTFLPGTQDYRAFCAEPPAKEEQVTSAQVGIIGAVAGVVGSIQATEVIKYLVGMDNLLTNKILLFDGLQMKFRVLKLG